LLLDLPAASPAALRLQSAAPEWFEPLIRLKRGARCSEPPPHQGAQQCQSLARVCTPRLALGEAEFPWASSPWLLLLLVAERLTPRCWLDGLTSRPCRRKRGPPPRIARLAAGDPKSYRPKPAPSILSYVRARSCWALDLCLAFRSSLCPPLSIYGNKCLITSVLLPCIQILLVSTLVHLWS